MTDTPFESFNPSRRTFRSQSAIPGHRANYHRKYHDYLKKLQEKNKSLKASDSKDDNLKQRESGFQLYINGAHSAPPRRPPSTSRKRTDDPSHRNQTPAPFLSNFTSPTLSNTTQRTRSRRRHRREWTPITQTKIKTEQGSIIADIGSLNVHHKQQQSQPINNQITYRLNVDQSWMPNWYTNTKSTENKLSVSLSLGDIPTTIELTKSQQQTYRLSSPVGR